MTFPTHLPDALFEPLQYIKGVGPRRSESFERAGVKTAWDFLHWLPKRHYDRGDVRPIAGLREGESATIQGTVLRVRENRTRTGKLQTLVEIGDKSGSIEAVWWNQRFLKSSFAIGDAVILAGRVERFRGLQIAPDDYEVIASDDYEAIHAVGMVPGYPPIDGAGRKAVRRIAWELVTAMAPRVPEYLPGERLAARGFLPLPEALRAAHFPKDAAELARARERLAYDEFFLVQLSLAARRRGLEHQKVGKVLRVSDSLDLRIRARFPFKLTRAQERVVGELRRDLTRERPMNRLLQGDVGSGKTLVAAYAVLAAIGNKAQAAVMAPTEILAEQHYGTFTRMLTGSRVRIALLAGSKSKERAETLAKIAAGEVDLVIGTHAVVQADVTFRDLALVVVDEQQKFGVMQRAALRLKGRRPHVLVMTATPIPRTLALTLYGDLDVSVIDEMPPGRKPVITRAVAPSKRADALRFVKAKLKEGRQAYFVYPLIEESDKVPLNAAVKMHETLSRELAPHPVALLHGRMKPEEKDAVMEEFRAGRAKALVSTLVVEVGIDVPNASVMVIGDADRYGLSPLHQLRGRIGRGGFEGYCLAFADPKSAEAQQRIAAFCSTSDGFKIAEADLRLRGPGEIHGTRQSGVPEFRVADLVRDQKLLGWAREDAFAVEPTALMKEYLARWSVGRGAISS